LGQVTEATYIDAAAPAHAGDCHMETPRMPHRLTLGLAGLLAAGLLAAPALAQEPSTPTPTKLVLSETATREVEQDTLVAVLSARADAAAPREAQGEVNAAMTEAVAAARAVEGVRLATGGYRVYQHYDKDGQPIGWVAEQDLRLTAKESAPLLELVGQLQDAGLNLNGLGYQLSDEARRAIEDELTIEAIERLRTRAGRIAEAMAMRLETIETMRIGDALGGPTPRPMYRTAMAEAMDMAPPVALPDVDTVSVGVEAEIALLPR
jgi:predicted secreted protein